MHLRMANIIRHSTFDLLPKGPSSTRWLIEDSNLLPGKLFKTLQSATPRLIGRPSLGEVYDVREIAWANNPTLKNASNNQTVTRDLAITFTCVKTSGGIRRGFTIPLNIKGIPVPNTKGACTYGADEYYIHNLLKQKPGVFPVSSEDRPATAPSREFLWKTPTTVFLQNDKNLVVQGFRKNGQAENQPIIIPKRLWGQFAKALETHRNTSDSNISFQNLPEDTELHQIIQKGLDFSTQEKTDYQVHQWLKQTAGAKVPDGSWKLRMETLKTEYPDLADSIDILNNSSQWDIIAARAAETLCDNLPVREFLPPNHLGRLRVETGVDLINQWILGQIEQIFNEAATHVQKQDNNSLTILTPWHRHNWEHELQKFFISPSTPKLINEAATPAAMAIKANLIKNSYDLFGRNNQTTTPNFTADINRTVHPSSIGFIATTSPETVANVGVDHWLCSGAQRNPETGEIEIPVMLKQDDGAWQRIWMNSERYDALERKLAGENSGIHIGRPDPNASRVLLRNQLQLIKTCPPGEVTAYIDHTPQDMLPLHLATAAGIHPARFPMAHAGENNARVCLGSEPPVHIDPLAEKALEKLTNAGITMVSPVDGKILSVSSDGEFQSINIEDFYGNIHICEIPLPKINAFKNPIGSIACVKPGDAIKQGETIAGPEQSAYKNQISGRRPGALHTGVNLSAAVIPLGIEDQIVFSAHTAASGRLNTFSTETVKIQRKDHPVIIHKIQPGSLVAPSEVLAVQIVDGKEIPITAPRQGGMLQRVKFVLNEKNPNIGTPVTISKQSRKTTLSEIINLQIHDAVKEPAKLAQSLDKKYVEAMKKEGIDPLECLQNFTATHTDKDGVQKQLHLTLQELQTSAGQKRLHDILANPGNNIHIDKKASFLNESLLYAVRKIEEAKTLLGQTVPVHQIPKAAKIVVFEILTEKPFQKGSKLNDPQGTKGIVTISPYLPFHKTPEGGMAPVDMAFTTHAVVARGSIPKFKQKSSSQTVLIPTQNGQLQKLEVQILPTYYNVQKSDTSLNKVQGSPTKQGRNHQGINMEGANMSRESQVLAASMLPMFLETASEPESRRLADFAAHASHLDDIRREPSRHHVTNTSRAHGTRAHGAESHEWNIPL